MKLGFLKKKVFRLVDRRRKATKRTQLDKRIQRWLQQPSGILAVSSIHSFIALLECTIAPWAPFIIVTAGSALAIPKIARIQRFGSFKGSFLRAGKFLAAVIWFDLIWENVVWGKYSGILLARLGKGHPEHYSEKAATEALMKEAASRHGLSQKSIERIMAFFFLVWAPLGEELFYRGYIHGGLRKKYRFSIAAIISASFFALRHFIHFLYLSPKVPWKAALSAFVYTFIPGLYLCYLYEKSGSIILPIAEHCLVNGWLIGQSLKRVSVNN
jgi:membrane protease YdiL (CAAX protease family)